MRSERVASEGHPTAAAARVRALVAGGDSVAGAVAEIIEGVRGGGDAALRRYTERFDSGGTAPPPRAVSEAELDDALGTLEPELRAGLQMAIEHVDRVARAGLRGERTVEFADHAVTLREAPVHRAAIYVPGGRAPYPSTVVMGVVTARAAGVQQVAVCSPPGPAGVDPVVLATCRLAGATEVHRMGGAHAVAALALGTETIVPVDVICGPGNLYVQEAKRQLSGEVGIDSFAGPSDLLVIADPGQQIDAISLDLLAQTEHGPGTLVVVVSTSAELLDAVAQTLAQAPETGAIAAVVEVASPDEALTFSEALAPEHLELIGPQAEELAGRVTRAGCVFVGESSATAFGDYIAGSNHTLPTGGSARFASALSTLQFRRSFTEVRIHNGSALARAAAPIARAEGFEFHARSMEARIRDH